MLIQHASAIVIIQVTILVPQKVSLNLFGQNSTNRLNQAALLCVFINQAPQIRQYLGRLRFVRINHKICTKKDPSQKFRRDLIPIIFQKNKWTFSAVRLYS